MEPKFTHIVLTRFNVRLKFTSGVPSTSHEWLLPRLRLFETFCLPSMLAQTVPHQWLVLFDANTPSDIQNQIKALGVFSPVWIEGFLDNVRIADLVSRRLKPTVTHLITTRLDNDDAIADDFLFRIQKAFAGQNGTYLNFPRGYQWQNRKLYYSFQFSNPFLSYVECLRTAGKATRVSTVYSGRHAAIRKTAPVQQLWAPPMWVQVLHGGNVANEMNGIRRPRSAPPSQFSHLELSEDGWMSRAVDLLRSVGYIAVLPWRKRSQLIARCRRALSH